MGASPETEPVKELKQLVEKFGLAETARRLSLAPTSVSKWMSEGRCRPMANLAAAKILDDQEARKQCSMLYFVRVPRERRELFETFVSGMSLQSRSFSEE